MKHFDHIIIGTGQATGTLLGKLTQNQDSIAVIEGHKIGGSCVNYGCTPTKALVASARAIRQAQRGAEYGFEAEPKVDFKRVMQRMNEIRGASNKGMTEWLRTTEQITLYRGFAHFESDRVVVVNGEKLTADKIYINVGTRSVAPPIDGLDNVPWLDSERLLELSALPSHLIIVGGGYVGVELGHVFRRLGAKVTLIQRGDQLMNGEDKDIAEAIQHMLEEEGVDVRLRTSAKSVKQTENGLSLRMEGQDEEVDIDGSHILIAAGRVPNSDTLKLDSSAIEVNEHGFIKVDEHCQTAVPDVYAVGDVNGKGAFTHTSVNDAEIVLDHQQGGSRSLLDRIPIYALFTDPPLGRVGLSEKEAIKRGYKVLKATMAMSEISRAKEMSETHGMAKLLIDAETDLILGAAVYGPGGDEIINMFAAIMHSKIPCHEYRKVVLVHPTVSELMPFALDRLERVN